MARLNGSRARAHYFGTTGDDWQSPGGIRGSFRFFYENAGYCVGRRAQGALDLARAESWAEEFGVVFAWDWEQDVDDSWMSEAERKRDHEWTRLVASYGSYVVSIGGIVDADNAYRRVIEAEMACELLSRVNEDLSPFSF